MDGKQLIAAIAIIINDKGGILLQKRADPVPAWAYGKWELPGGGVEFGEDPADTVRREVKEETGCAVTITGIHPKIFSFTRNNEEGQGYHLIILPYYCKLIGDALPQPGDAEVEVIQWFMPQEILDLDCLPGIHEIASSLAHVR